MKNFFKQKENPNMGDSDIETMVARRNPNLDDNERLMALPPKSIGANSKLSLAFENRDKSNGGRERQGMLRDRREGIGFLNLTEIW